MSPSIGRRRRRLPVYAADPVDARCPAEAEDALVLLHSPRAARAVRRAGRRPRAAASGSPRSARRPPTRRATAGAPSPSPPRRATKRCWSLPPSCARLSAATRRAAMNGDYDPVDTYGAPPGGPWLRPAARARSSPSCSASARWAMCSPIGTRPRGRSASRPTAPPAPAPRAPARASGRRAASRRRRTRGRRDRARADRDRPGNRPPRRRARAAVGQVGTESRAAVGNADRAEGLLVAFAARRALDRGVALGFLEALLRQRFGETQPRAVGMIILAARNPVTLQELQLGLQEAGPQLVGSPPGRGLVGRVQGRARLADHRPARGARRRRSPPSGCAARPSGWRRARSRSRWPR